MLQVTNMAALGTPQRACTRALPSTSAAFPLKAAIRLYARGARARRSPPHSHRLQISCGPRRRKGPPQILCAGEVLWDCSPLGLFLGGAPANVACHLSHLGMNVELVSKVGDDQLGREVKRRLEAKHVGTKYLQTAEGDLETGLVLVEMGEEGIPQYEIVQPSAWDEIAMSEEVLEAAGSTPCIVFGSLGQRSDVSRETIQALVAANSRKVFDVNLRAPFFSKELVESCLPDTYLVKVNDEELEVLNEWLQLGPVGSLHKDLAKELAARYGCEQVCITRGAAGAGLWVASLAIWVDHPGFKVSAVDTVGAGDSFLARLLQGLLQGEPHAMALAEANAVGAYVATCSGATPDLDFDAIKRIRHSSGKNPGV